MSQSIENVKKIAVEGSGTMGAGIAQMAALAAYDVILYDLKDEALKKAEASIEKNLQAGVDRNKISPEDKINALKRISYTSEINDLIADFHIEAVVEKLNVKQELFKKLASINKEDAILATNTSSIPVTRIAAEIPNPDRVVGMHFFNPAHIMKLVEIISGAATSEKTAQTAKNLAEKMGKVAVKAQDSPGFIVNRVARPFYVEGLKILEENVADHITIDNLLEASGFKMGPFKLMDLIGVDTNFSVTSSMFESFYFDPKFRPSRIQQQKVDAGHHGKKSGRGFYVYQ